MIQTFKLLHGFDDIKFDKFFKLNTKKLTGSLLEAGQARPLEDNSEGNLVSCQSHE